MPNIRVHIVSKGINLPTMECHSFFHSDYFFLLAEKIPGHKPYMVIAEDENNRIIGHLLALVRWHGSLFPPYLYSQGRIFGEGEYADGVNKEMVFGVILKEVTKLFKRNLVLYTEFSDISHKMFGYKNFRENDYFPIGWQEIHNSLHNRLPILQLTDKTRRQIRQSKQIGVETKEATSSDEMQQYHKMLKKHFRTKFRRFIPNVELFQELQKSNYGKTFITIYKDKIIGGCTCVYSGNNAYLWFLGSKRKLYHHLHPGVLTIWYSIEYAFKKQFQHIYFLDAGLPFKKSSFREFILRFGGKPVTKYRWFRITIPWVNKFLSWLFRE